MLAYIFEMMDRLKPEEAYKIQLNSKKLMMDTTGAPVMSLRRKNCGSRRSRVSLSASSQAPKTPAPAQRA